jgi:tungstate transport system ATP-binding protein
MELGLKIIDVQKRYNGKVTLRNCSYSFESGGIYALMGPNGCGKSTLLRACALLEPVDGGNVLYSSGEAALPHDIALRRRITLVLPRVGIFNATVFKNVAYGLAIRGMDRGSIARKVTAVLDAVGLKHKEQQNALTLSSGETQRLGIARAMVVEPEILFLDEPTASIDEENTAIVEKIILALKRGGKTTIIMSTHDRDQAERLADRRVLMRNGEIVSGASR